MWNSIVILYCILFTLYGVFSLWSFWRAVQDAFKMKQFFEDRLGISDQRLEGGAVDWDRDVVAQTELSLQEGEIIGLPSMAKVPWMHLSYLNVS
jgi:hypothetical protein